MTISIIDYHFKLTKYLALHIALIDHQWTTMYSASVHPIDISQSKPTRTRLSTSLVLVRVVFSSIKDRTTLRANESVCQQNGRLCVEGFTTSLKSPSLSEGQKYPKSPQRTVALALGKRGVGHVGWMWDVKDAGRRR